MYNLLQGFTLLIQNCTSMCVWFMSCIDTQLCELTPFASCHITTLRNMNCVYLHQQFFFIIIAKNACDGM